MAEAGQWSLFGYDLRRVGQCWRNGWQEIFAWPLLSALSPAEAVRVHLPAGGEELRAGLSARVLSPAEQQGAEVRAEAVLLDDDMVLERTLLLPPLGIDALAQAVQLEAAELSPFGSEDTAAGWHVTRAQGQMQVRLALASRQQVLKLLAAQGKPATQVEVWAGAGQPVLLSGFGEAPRAARLRRRRGQKLAALLLCAALLTALIATPVLQARARTLDALEQFSRLERETHDLVVGRSILATGQEQLQALQLRLADQVDIPLLLEALTAALPDSAFLTRLELQGRQLRIAGQAENASSLLSALGAPGTPFREVRAPSPISRQPGSNRDNFVIELQFVGAAAGEAL